MAGTFDPFVSGVSGVKEGQAATKVAIVDPFFGAIPRLTLFDLARVGENNSSLEVQFNPSEFTEKVEALYGRLQPIGQPHQVLQYQGTGNHTITLTLFYLAQDVYSRLSGKFAKKWLLSMLYPQRSASTVVGGSPSDVLVVWPNTLAMTCRLMRIVFSNQRFRRNGEVIQFSAQCTFEERRTTRWTSEDAREYGSLKVPAES